MSGESLPRNLRPGPEHFFSNPILVRSGCGTPCNTLTALTTVACNIVLTPTEDRFYGVNPPAFLPAVRCVRDVVSGCLGNAGGGSGCGVGMLMCWVTAWVGRGSVPWRGARRVVRMYMGRCLLGTRGCRSFSFKFSSTPRPASCISRPSDSCFPDQLHYSQCEWCPDVRSSCLNARACTSVNASDLRRPRYLCLRVSEPVRVFDIFA
jgi:hypothetical protein